MEVEAMSQSFNAIYPELSEWISARKTNEVKSETASSGFGSKSGRREIGSEFATQQSRKIMAAIP